MESWHCAIIVPLVQVVDNQLTIVLSEIGFIDNNKANIQGEKMTLQTVFVTNRNLNIGKNKKKGLFGNDIDKRGTIRLASAKHWDKKIEKKYKINRKITRIRRSIKKTYELDLIVQDQQASWLESVVQAADNGKPWVLFLHGNNQTLSKNLVKSRIIQEKYDVNMIIFSWPSRSYDPPFVEKLVAGGLLATNPSTLLLGKWLMKKAVKAKMRQYKIAQKYAVKTAPHFAAAFNLLFTHLLQPIRQAQPSVHLSLLVHSLGNYVLQNLVEQHINKLPDFKFDSCLIHQADVDDANHQSWLSVLPLAKSENTHVTRNRPDNVLFLSGLANNNFNLNMACSRLGNRWNRDSESGAPFEYIDFTDFKGVGFTHGVAWQKYKLQEVRDECDPVLKG